ncbi:MAG: zf-HC2 domain-containing protein [Phycisphaera sp. RhM]|nr:zf-HC2 domain-containing protein [Phycisphaera sp. RhM]
MNCNETQNLLAAYYDDELSVDERASVSEHLEACHACSESLAGYRRLSAMFSHAATPPVPSSTWGNIVQRLETHGAAETNSAVQVVASGRNASVVELASDPKENRLATRNWSRATYQRLAIAASILLVLGLSVWMSRPDSMPEMDHEHSKEFVATMDHYLRALPENPDAAEQFLLHKYDGKVVAPNEAVHLVGYRPAVADGLPQGYSLASTSVLKMPCCTCVKAVCKRQDGSTLVLFEHDDEEVDWFGDRTSSMAMCGDKECCLVDLDSSIAATWREGPRSVTAVGVKDQEEVTALVRWFKQT